MSYERDSDVPLSLWCEAKSFGEGLSVEFKTELDKDDFQVFAQLLREYWEAPFNAVESRLEEEAKVSVATPKPKQIDFKNKCIDCQSEISNSNIHFEIIGEKSFQMICRDCFFRAVFSGGEKR